MGQGARESMSFVNLPRKQQDQLIEEVMESIKTAQANVRFAPKATAMIALAMALGVARATGLVSKKCKSLSKKKQDQIALSFVTSQTGDQWAVDAAKARHPST